MRAIFVALVLCVAVVPSAQATIGYVDDEGNVTHVSEGAISEFGPVLETPDEDVPCPPSANLVCHAAKVHMAKRKTSRAYGEYQSGYRNRMVSATLESTWTRDRWRVLEPVVGKVIPFVAGDAGVVWSIEHVDPVIGRPYQYKGHGMGSGYILESAVDFKWCLPTKVYCFARRRISVQLNLHADGSFKRISHVSSGKK